MGHIKHSVGSIWEYTGQYIEGMGTYWGVHMGYEQSIKGIVIYWEIYRGYVRQFIEGIGIYWTLCRGMWRYTGQSIWGYFGESAVGIVI